MTWDDWVEMQGTRGPEWQIRYDEAALGELRADFQDVPTPRFVFCIFDPANADSEATVPLVVKACDQAGVAGGVDVRLFPADLHPDLVDQFRTDDEITPTTCVVFDQGWIQVGLWRGMTGLRPGGDPEREKETLRDLLEALRGQPHAPWRAPRYISGHLQKQAERSAEGAP